MTGEALSCRSSSSEYASGAPPAAPKSSWQNGRRARRANSLAPSSSSSSGKGRSTTYEATQMRSGAKTWLFSNQKGPRISNARLVSCISHPKS